MELHFIYKYPLELFFSFVFLGGALKRKRDARDGGLEDPQQVGRATSAGDKYVLDATPGHYSSPLIMYILYIYIYTSEREIPPNPFSSFLSFFKYDFSLLMVRPEKKEKRVVSCIRFIVSARLPICLTFTAHFKFMETYLAILTDRYGKWEHQ